MVQVLADGADPERRCGTSRSALFWLSGQERQGEAAFTSISSIRFPKGSSTKILS